MIGDLQEPKHLLLTGTSVTDVLTMAANETQVFTVIRLAAVNRDSSDRKVTFFKTEDSTDLAIAEAIVGANSTIDFPMNSKMFAKSHARKIRAQAAAGNVVTVTVEYTLSKQADASQSGPGR
jgi:hypothetical protein